MKSAGPTDPTGDAARGLENSLWLVIASSSGVEAMPLPDGDFVIGRATECDVVIDDESVSRRHAIVRDRLIEDLGSRNGTTVRDQRLEKGQRAGLDVGGVVEIGTATLMLHRGPPPRGPSTSSPTPSLGGADAPVLTDPTMRRLHAMLDVVAPSDLSVLILGETGTGKEVFASQIHARSARRTAPFLRLNCAALSGSLLESELFGHEKGAFTGAIAAKQGLFESADGGTVFLDEVGELPIDTQAKLLRVLENGEVLRLGSVKPKRVDVRYVSATNRDLTGLVQTGIFRSDLYYRLNGVTVTLPPLRRRTSEILPLADRFTALAAARAKRTPPRISDIARNALLRHRWPGNVRELKTVLDRAVVLCAGGPVVDIDHLLLPELSDTPPSVPPVRPPSATMPPPTPTRVDPMEKERILEALQRSGANQTEAAKLLGVSRRTLINKMEKYGLARPRKR